jgi:hypothetical protein
MSDAAAGSKKAPLDEVMLAMDVVDTLRRRRRLVEQELDTEGREQSLEERLRKIYDAQGIEVSDHVLKEGVAALKEERFVYKPPPNTLATRLARIYIRRGTWGKWIAGGLAVLVVVSVLYHFMIVAPRNQLPADLEALHRSVVEMAKSDQAKRLADDRLATAQAALREDDQAAAREMLASLNDLGRTLQQTYDLQIVSRPGARSGVWRIPDVNSNARNYYIIVEAVGADGNPLRVPVVNEETGKTEMVSQWGLRVDQQVFQRIAADKEDDGIIQDRRVGVKKSGYLRPDYRIPTTGAAITQW